MLVAEKFIQKLATIEYGKHSSSIFTTMPLAMDRCEGVKIGQFFGSLC